VIHRVEPAYPNVAMMAQVQGTVILEVTVGADGCVQSVRVLSS
jgi:TonB family protein